MSVPCKGAAAMTAGAMAAALLGLALLGPVIARPGAAPAKAAAATAAPQPLVWTDVDGRGYGPTQIKAAAATVFVFGSTECPLASAYAGRLRALEQEYFAKRVSFFLVNAHPSDTADTARTWARERKLSLPVVKDVASRLVDRLGATRTPEAVVVDRAGNVVYRGRIDDDKDPARVRAHHLRDALDAVLAGKTVARARIPVKDGCLILRETAVAAARPASRVTYARDVAPLLNAQCVSCHREGEVAPFALDTYAQAKLWAPMLADVVKRRIMPPWKPAPGYGDFHGARALTEQEIATLTSWAEAGAPAGDLKAAPKPPVFPAGWSQGTPDLVVAPERSYELAGEGSDVYRCFVLPAEFKEDAFVTLSQVRPGNRAVVHHVIVYVDPTGTKSLQADAADEADGFDNPRAGAGPPVDGAYWLVGWAPGGEPRPLPPGSAVPVPKGARLVMEVHYHRSGRDETDRTALGLTFTREPVRKIATMWDVVQPRLNITAGDPAHRVSGRMNVSEDITLDAIAPHMHQIGKEMRVWATRPDGTREELIWLKDWDFNWQTGYYYKRPVKLPKGTKIEMEAVFDNSPENPRNPNRPPKTVTWGEATTDEMCIAFLFGTRDGENLDVRPAAWQNAVVPSAPGAIEKLTRALRVAAGPK